MVNKGRKRLEAVTAYLAHLNKGPVLGLEAYWTKVTKSFIRPPSQGIYNRDIIGLGYLYIGYVSEKERNVGIEYHFLDVRRIKHVESIGEIMKEVSHVISPEYKIVRSVLYQANALPKVLKENGMDDRMEEFGREIFKGFESSTKVENLEMYRELKDKLKELTRKKVKKEKNMSS